MPSLTPFMLKLLLQMNLEPLGKLLEMPLELLLPSKKDSN
jgi:hypothetical protein